MRDRQLFQNHQLANGIRVYEYPERFGFTYLNLQVPVGSAHSVAPLIPGTFHMMEHLAMNRSQLYPARSQFNQFLGLRGGSLNAITGPFWTTFVMDVPDEHLAEALPGFYSLIFEPLVSEADLALERGIVSSERRMKERWFPGRTELDQYVLTKLVWDCPMSLRQRLGFDEDLAAITPDYLHKVLNYYRDPRMRLIVGGKGDASWLYQKLSQLKLMQYQLGHSYEPLRWVRQKYHTKAFRDVSRHILSFGGIVTPAPDFDTSRAILFILDYLTNSVHGPLYQWLREEKGWVYNVDREYSTAGREVRWALEFPMADKTQVKSVREQLFSRIDDALSDNRLISQEVERILSSKVYWYQTLGRIVDDAIFSLEEYDEIVTEQGMVEAVEKCRDRSYLQKVWHSYATPNLTGMFCAAPMASRTRTPRAEEITAQTTEILEDAARQNN